VLVRAARREPRPRDLTRLAARVITTLAATLAIASCSGRATGTTRLSWTLTPTSPAVGPASLTVTLRDPAGIAVTGAKVRLEGHMSHPGMTPVIADAAERTPGVYVAPFTFTMPGDWVLLVSAALPHGGRLEQRIEVAGVRP
jgi:YtkA-like